MMVSEWEARRLAVNEHRLLRRHARAAVVLALSHGVLILVFHGFGLFPSLPRYPWVLLAVLVVLAVVYQGLVEMGVTLRWREASLSLPLSLGLTLLFLATALPMNEGRIGAMMLFYPLMLLVSFRLDTGALAGVALFASGGYATMVAVATEFQGELLNPRLELLQWLVFTLVSFSFVVTGCGMSGLRRSLAMKNQALAETLDQVRHRAIRDDLTGVFNRRHVMEILNQHKALANGRDYPFSICYVDLDHFKHINDSYGHDWGDRVLRHFAEHAQGSLREGDYLARLGGEEFILVLPQSGLAGALRMAERLRTSWASHDFSPTGGPATVSLCAGVACYRRGESVDQLIARADRALYLAKSSGRNRVKNS